MIAQAKFNEIRQLLDEGILSQRKISRRLGVSRGTVNAIAQGKRTERFGIGIDDMLPFAGPPRRCPGCGGLVLMPCLLCHVRSLRKN